MHDHGIHISDYRSAPKTPESRTNTSKRRAIVSAQHANRPESRDDTRKVSVTQRCNFTLERTRTGNAPDLHAATSASRRNATKERTGAPLPDRDTPHSRVSTATLLAGPTATACHLNRPKPHDSGVA